MSGNAAERSAARTAITVDRRAARKAVTTREILDAAWALAREQGLTAISMRELGARVGMRAQSLYVYFPSKHAIFDAMFADANRDLLARMRESADKPANDAKAALIARTEVFLRFCVEDQVRFQLLFQRTIPGFEPSPESYAPAVQVVETGLAALRACGVDDQRGWDTWTALIGGLASQQNSNEPGGRRYLRLVEEVTDMYLNFYQGTKKRRPS